MSGYQKRMLGFTLLEVLLVLSLLGILLFSVSSSFSSSLKFTRQKVHEANIEQIEGAAQIYRLDTGVYPSSVQDLVQPPLELAKWRGPYLESVPINPFNSSFSYQIDAKGNVR